MSKSTEQNKLINELVKLISGNALKKYRIEPGKAREIINHTLMKYPGLNKLLEKYPDVKLLRRTSAFDEINKNAKKTIYYYLRTYHQGSDEQKALIEKIRKSHISEKKELAIDLAATHSSVKERKSSLDEFYNKLAPYLDQAKNIIDVGCGLHPLTFPFNNFPVERYLALDNNETSTDILKIAKSALEIKELTVKKWNISEGWQDVRKKNQNFDLAFLMKLVPAVLRQDKELEKILLETPAETWIISGSKISLTKKQSIEKREHKIINKFIEKSEKQKTEEFSIAGEFCIIVR